MRPARLLSLLLVAVCLPLAAPALTLTPTQTEIVSDVNWRLPLIPQGMSPEGGGLLNVFVYRPRDLAPLADDEDAGPRYCVELDPATLSVYRNESTGLHVMNDDPASTPTVVSLQVVRDGVVHVLPLRRARSSDMRRSGLHAAPWLTKLDFDSMTFLNLGFERTIKPTVDDVVTLVIEQLTTCEDSEPVGRQTIRFRLKTPLPDLPQGWE